MTPTVLNTCNCCDEPSANLTPDSGLCPDCAPETCERCDGSGVHLGDNPGTPRRHECAGCDGTGRP